MWTSAKNMTELQASFSFLSVQLNQAKNAQCIISFRCFQLFKYIIFDFAHDVAFVDVALCPFQGKLKQTSAHLKFDQ